ncbi:hypothetical protein GCK32_021543, partial [Trichostrongylus colubriformis]
MAKKRNEYCRPEHMRSRSPTLCPNRCLLHSKANSVTFDTLA